MRYLSYMAFMSPRIVNFTVNVGHDPKPRSLSAGVPSEPSPSPRCGHVLPATACTHESPAVRWSPLAGLGRTARPRPHPSCSTPCPRAPTLLLAPHAPYRPPPTGPAPPPAEAPCTQPERPKPEVAVRDSRPPWSTLSVRIFFQNFGPGINEAPPDEAKVVDSGGDASRLQKQESRLQRKMSGRLISLPENNFISIGHRRTRGNGGCEG